MFDAIVGAIGTVFTILKGLYQLIQDKPKLSVELGWHAHVDEPHVFYELKIRATNQGRRPISIEKLGITIGGIDLDVDSQMSDKLPKKLGETDIVNGGILLTNVMLANEPTDYAVFGWVKDHAHKKYLSVNSIAIKKEWLGNFLFS
ncbi:MAG TPA: hypothetical protein VFF13_06125 [archaeon]|nr:hypothetical protein [archaeon]